MDKIILDACCGGKMFWYDKNNENTIYVDNRKVEKGAFKNNWNPNWCVKQDIETDFRNLPFEDNSFKLVVYDPPHLTSGSEKSVINMKYGILNKETWKKDLIDGFKECWRVLDNYGTLIFKWNIANIKTSEVLKDFPEKPLFGDFTGKTGKTIWMTFLKIPKEK
jgi:SAM-dependent methyltransferase